MSMQAAPHLTAHCVVSIGAGGSSSPDERIFHAHTQEEICLVDKSPTVIRYADTREALVQPGTVVLFVRGERHGFENRGRHTPSFWVVNFDGARFLRHHCGAQITQPRRTDRFRTLSPLQIQTFKSCFSHIAGEAIRHGARAGTLQALWLEILLLSVMVPATDGDAPRTADDPQAMELWALLNANLHKGLTEALDGVDINYDSVRHRFRAAFGQSPGTVHRTMRMERAKYLLLTSDLSIKEIAPLVGFARQHEFCRAFTNAIGVAPTKFRANHTA